LEKAKRSYQSSRRQESAQFTRKIIAQAALQLFKQRGYMGASVDAIAEAAAVAPETIYATFGSKREILHHLINISVGGDDAPVPVMERPEQQAVLQLKDAGKFVSGFSEGITKIMERAAPVFSILAEAAKTEPKLADLQNRMRAERLDNMRRVIQTLHKLVELRVDESQAAETLWTLTSPELFTLLTVVRQWPNPRYAAWLQDSIIRLLFQEEKG
jgi:AcrR family transcriptional regulator